MSEEAETKGAAIRDCDARSTTSYEGGNTMELDCLNKEPEPILVGPSSSSSVRGPCKLQIV
jgi:hypothetical protein